MRPGPILKAAISLLALAPVSAQAAPPTSIIRDGSLGPAGPVSSTNPGFYEITPSMGKTVGSNLFQSFGTFNLGTGDTADFTANPGTQNIIARVTGGSASTIDGTLESAANLYFINPAGIMFTANAQLNVNGAFVASTANYAKLSDGTIFYADLSHPINDAGLSSAPISAFGFTSATPQPVTFTGPTLTNAGGIHVIAGDTTLDQGTPTGGAEQGTSLLAPGGNLTLFSAASTGKVLFSLSSPGSGFASTTNSAFGNITIKGQSSVGIDGAGGGAVVIRGGRMVLDDSYISSIDFGSVEGGSISVQAEQLSITNGAGIISDTFGGAAAGAVTVNVAGALQVSGMDPVSGAHSEISANTESSGPGGDINVTADSVDLNDGGIFANGNDVGQAGDIRVTADSMSMEANARLSSVSDGSSGNAGTVTVELAGLLTMTGTSAIFADTYTSGNGGDISVTATQIVMTGETLISSDTDLSFGSAGHITIKAQSLSIQGAPTGYPGSIGIFAEELNGGTAGTIDITVDNFSLGGKAVISSENIGLSSGDAGNILVRCSQGQLSDQSDISSSSFFGNAGSVRITAGDSFTLASGSSVSASAGLQGGNVTLKVGQLLYLSDSAITAYSGKADPAEGFTLTPAQEAAITGGNISIDPQFFVLDNSVVSANSGGAHGGNIMITANDYLNNESSITATGTTDGTITISSPELDLGGSLLPLPAVLVNDEKRLRESCARSVNHESSSLIVVGRGGTELAPDELQPDFGMK